MGDQPSTAVHGVTLDVSVVIPLRDEERNVVQLHEELSTVLGALGASYEVIFIDDGSEDATFARLTEIHARDPHVRVVEFARNFGQTAAFAAGFAHARGRLIVTMDGDLQNDPADIPRLLTVAREYDIVSGWRKDRKDNFFTRYLPSLVANLLIGLASGVPLHDVGCSLKVYRADVVKPLKLSSGMHRYLPALASQLGGRVKEIVVHHRPRLHGQSKYGLSRTFRVVRDIPRLRRLMREAIEPTTSAGRSYEIRQVLED